jgi:hypothetical protein
MSDDYIARIERVLACHSISTYRFDRTRRHRRLIAAYDGREITITFPTSPSRDPRQCEADLRGLFEGRHRKPRRAAPGNQE